MYIAASSPTLATKSRDLEVLEEKGKLFPFSDPLRISVLQKGIWGKLLSCSGVV